MEGFRAFDFDAWRELAALDPDGFEVRRQHLIESVIQASDGSSQARLRGLQFRMDMERRRSSNPMAACLRISNMMWDALLGPGGLYASLNLLIKTANGVTSTRVPEAEPALTAQVISFPKRMQSTHEIS